MTCLTDLPSEILQNITTYVQYNIDLCALSQTNRCFYYLASKRLDLHLRRVFQSQFSYPESRAFHWAAMIGNETCVRRLLRAGILPPPPKPDWHPIMFAAKRGHANVVRVFLEYGMDPNPPVGSFLLGKFFGNPLTAAVEEGHESVVRLLIDHGVDLEFTRQEVRIKQPLSLATQKRHTSLVKLLLEHGCNPLTPDYVPNGIHEESAWQIAAGCDLSILRMFIDKGIQPDFSGPGTSYHRMIMDALRKDDIPLVKFLLDRGVKLEKPTHLYSFYSHALERVHSDDMLYQVSRAAGKSPQESEFLLEKVDVDKIITGKDLRSIVSLTVGATHGGHENLMKRLLDANWASKRPTVRIEEWKDHLSSCLTEAARRGHTNLVNLLLDYGADAKGVIDDKQTQSGYYPPIFAAAERGFSETVKLLLDRGANPFPRQRHTLLEKIVCQPVSEARMEIIRFLVERDILMPKMHDNRSFIVQAVAGGAKVFQLVLQHMGVELQIGDPYHEEALVAAVKAGDAVIIETFLTQGFDPNSVSKSSRNRSPSFLALAANAEGSPRIRELAVDLLLKYGADLDWQNPQTDLPPLLMFEGPANSRCREEAVRILLKKGADPFFKCKKCGDWVLVKEAKRAGLSTVKALLESFDERKTSFFEIKAMVEEAARATRSGEVAELLWRWYWRRAYPCPMD